MGVGVVRELVERLGSVVRDFDPHVCEGGLAREYVREFARLERLAGAGKTLALGRVDRTGAWADGPGASRSVADWLAAETGAPVGDAIRDTDTARRLDGLAGTTGALRAGVLSAAQVREIAGAAVEAPGAEHDLLVLAGSGRPFKVLRDQARKVRAASQDDATRAERQRRLRRARRWSDEEGMRCYGIALTPSQAAMFEPAWDVYCNQVFDIARLEGLREPQDAYAADALVLMAHAALGGAGATARERDGTAADNGAGPAGGFAGSGAGVAGRGVRAHVLVLVDAAALRRGHTVAGETCEIAGIGAIDVAAAKLMAGDATIDILIRDGIDVRTVAHAGRGPNRRQRAALLADWECEVRGCGRTRYLEVDHIVPYSQSRQSAIEDLGAKCRYHHYLKTHKGWRDSPRGDDGKRDLIPPDTPDPPPRT